MDKEAIRLKYAKERDKRLRTDGNEQYITLEKASYYGRIPTSTLKSGSCTRPRRFCYVGGGFAGLCTGAGVVEGGKFEGRSNMRLVGMWRYWYWNRYPGCMCDSAAIVYAIPGGGHIPDEYAHTPEILLQSKKIAHKYGLYENILLQTKVTSISWEEEHNRWRVKTNRYVSQQLSLE